MGRLPDFRRAIIPRRKLRYCLDPSHAVGKHKARVFRSALGLELDGVKILECMLREGISSCDAAPGTTLSDGTERWAVEWVVRGRLGPLRFVSAWDVDRLKSRPRLVSCYLKRVKT